MSRAAIPQTDEIHQYAQFCRSDLDSVVRETLPARVDPEDWVTAAFHLHQFVYTEVPYESRHDDGVSRPVREPAVTLERGGNCEEQCILLASLLSTAGIDHCFLSLHRSDRAHLSMWCGDLGSTEEVDLDIVELGETTGVQVEGIASQHTNENQIATIGHALAELTVRSLKDGTTVVRTRWYYCDPVMGGYLGDLSGLRTKDYITADGKWDCDVEIYDIRRDSDLSDTLPS